MQRPLVFFVLALVLGIIAATLCKIDSTVAILTTLATCFLTGIGILRTWRNTAWVLFGVCLSLGVSLTTLHQDAVKSLITQFDGKKVTISGEILDRPDVRPDGTFYKVQLRTIKNQAGNSKLTGVLRVKVNGQGRIFDYGDILQLQGRVDLPEPPGNPGAFDYRTWLNRQGIAATLYVEDAKNIRLLGRGGNFFKQTAFTLRDNLEKIFDQTMTKNHAVILKGLLFGTRGEIPRDVQQAFNETGLVHILSVSGYHVGLVAALVIALLRLARAPVQYTAWITIPVLIFYAFMTGLGPAVLRSTLMAILLLLAHHLGRPQDWPTTLAAAAGFILILNPLSLYDIGFQLSFVATWGLLYLIPRINDLLPKLPSSISLLITVPLAAQAATLPLVVLYFNLVSPVSVLANLLTTHLVVLVMLFGGLALMGGVVYLPLAALINSSTGLLTDLFIWLVKFCSALPGASTYIATPPLASVILYYLILVTSCELSQRADWRAKLKQVFTNVSPVYRKLIYGFLIFLLFAVAWFSWPVQDKLQVHFIDVGQGDSALIRTPNQRTVLVDAGGWQEELLTGKGAGDYAIVPYLHRLGINKLDALILTHPHADHVGGARAVLRAMPVELVIISPYGLEEEDNSDKGYDKLLQEIEQQSILLRTAKAGDRLKVDPAVDLTFLAPQKKYQGTRSDANNNSLVFKLSYQNRTVLFTGDIEAEAETELMKNNNAASEVLKVPHHGSGYFQQDFFAHIKPRFSVISAGANNRFGHPAPRTLEALTQQHSQIFRTDRQGAIILTTNGNQWEVVTGK